MSDSRMGTTEEVRKVVVLGFIFVLQSCGLTPLRIKARFDGVGEIGQGKVYKQKLKSSSQVKVYYASLPKGFYLKNEGLKVRRKYGHKVIGQIKVLGSGYGNKAKKSQIIASLKDKAFLEGANTVVFAKSAIGENPNLGEVLNIKENSSGEFGSGWAVIMKL